MHGPDLMTSAVFLLNLCNEHKPMILALVQDDPSFGAVQFTNDEVQSVLLVLMDVSKHASLDAIRLLF
jgi:hypothetical protein